MNRDNVVIEIIRHHEYAPIRGNVSAVDHETDMEAENAIIEELNHNPWAWCMIEVRATAIIKGEFTTASSYLGCCSYKNEEDFVKKSGYYDDMVEQSLADTEYYEDMIEKLLDETEDYDATEEME